ncbi:MAG: peptidoglycan-binding protein [Burkholderiaceae bacterium]
MRLHPIQSGYVACLYGAVLTVLLGLVPATVASAQTIRSGYLCCNAWTYNDWISDINYYYDGSKLLRVGSPIRAVEEASNSFKVIVGGKARWLGNDYSRSLSRNTFLYRYIVKDDPRETIKTFDAFTQDAISRLRVMPGMTKEQVAMAIGYPAANYTPSLKRRTWQYWLDSGSQVNAVFDKDGRLKALNGEWPAVSRVAYFPPKKVIAGAQTRLNELTLDAGEVDGLYGPTTRKAVRKFQEQVGLPTHGYLNTATLRALGIGIDGATEQEIEATAPGQEERYSFKPSSVLRSRSE